MTPLLHQDLRNCTVRIEDINGVVRGTGVIVTDSGLVATCEHVVKYCAVDPKRPGEGRLQVYFPQFKCRRQAVVVRCLSEYDDDVVLVAVSDPPLLSDQNVAKLGDAEGSFGSEFNTYGYRCIGLFQGLHGGGQILGAVETPEAMRLLAEYVQLRSQEIDEGMSGAAVLDPSRNLVVGLVSKKADPLPSGRDRDLGLAVNAKVLGASPLDITLHEQSLPAEEPPVLPTPPVMPLPRSGKLPPFLADAPVPLSTQWVGRDSLLSALTTQQRDGQRMVAALIGFGGEGKTSIARRWVDQVQVGDSDSSFDGVFWWDFYKHPSAEGFLDRAWDYVFGKQSGRGDESPSAKALMLAARCFDRRFLFVLDGFETMQYEEGEDFGLVRSEPLKLFLTNVAAGNHSFCLITSRAPILDLVRYSNYVPYDVVRLTVEEGELLLRKRGIAGSQATLQHLVEAQEGHALSLSLLSAYLSNYHNGTVSDDMSGLSADIMDNRFGQVQTVLKRYDQHLSSGERAFLLQISLFRSSVPSRALKQLAGNIDNDDALGAELRPYSRKQLETLAKRLVSYRLIQYDGTSERYTVHPLVRRHYLSEVEKLGTVKWAHLRIRRYYLSRLKLPKNPALGDLAPVIEAIHHSCRAGSYLDAWQIYSLYLAHEERKTLLYQLGAYETTISIMKEFFPDGDLRAAPLVLVDWIQGVILSTVGFCFQSMGRLDEVAQFYERCYAIESKEGYFENACRTMINTADLHIQRGELADARQAVQQAHDHALQSQSVVHESFALGVRAWVEHLAGNTQAALEAFRMAEQLEAYDLGNDTLIGQRGIRYADSLRRLDDARALEIAIYNLRYFIEHGLTDHASRCSRVLGDLRSAKGEPEAATAYDDAVRLARMTTHRVALMEALIARGRWLARTEQPDLSRVDLEEARRYVVSGYRLHEIDLRVALGWLHLAAGRKNMAQQEAERARSLSQQLSYYWGTVDAEELLQSLGEDAMPC